MALIAAGQQALFYLVWLRKSSVGGLYPSALEFRVFGRIAQHRDSD